MQLCSTVPLRSIVNPSRHSSPLSVAPSSSLSAVTQILNMSAFLDDMVVAMNTISAKFILPCSLYQINVSARITEEVLADITALNGVASGLQQTMQDKKEVLYQEVRLAAC